MLNIAESRTDAGEDGNRHLQLTVEWHPAKTCGGPLTVELRGRNLKTLNSNKWLRVECQAPGAELAWRTPEAPVFNDISAHNRTFTIGRWSLPDGVDAGDTVRFNVTIVPAQVSGAEVAMHVAALREDDVVEKEDEIIQIVPPGPVVAFDLFARGAPEADGAVRLTLVPVDANRYPARLETATAAKIYHGKDLVWEGEIREPTVITVPSPGNAVARFTAVVDTEQAPDQKRKVVSNPVWTEGIDARLPVFGEIHWHTSHSGDGMRPIREALRVSRDELKATT